MYKCYLSTQNGFASSKISMFTRVLLKLLDKEANPKLVSIYTFVKRYIYVIIFLYYKYKGIFLEYLVK